MDGLPKILLVDDRKENLLVLRKVLESVEADFVDATSGNEALTLTLEHSFALALVDVQMPGMDGYEMVELLRQDKRTELLPVIFISAIYSDEAHLIKGIESGAVDFVTKPIEPRILLGKVQVFLQLFRQREILADTVRALERSESRYRGLVETSQELIWSVDQEGCWSFLNQGAVEEIYGMDATEMMGKPFLEWVAPEHRETDRKTYESILQGYSVRNYQTTHLRKDGSPVHLAFSAATTHDGDGTIVGMTGTAVDITDRLRLEEQIRHSQRLESIGQLAGGVAHDFNNQLAGIVGYSELLQGQIMDPKHRRWVDGINSAAQHAAALTRQLLAFGRKGKNLEMLVNLNRTLDEVIELLERSIDKRIRIVQDRAVEVPETMGDPHQIHHAVLNVALNARDAMPSGGVLAFAVERVTLDCTHPLVQCGDVIQGSYLALSVTDTGMGMSEAVRAKVFEPFFTTKEVGEGTGMGLAAVYGTMLNHHGAVGLESTEGEGTTVTLYFQGEVASVVPDVPRREKPIEGRGTILLIEDEELVRGMAADMLEELGYTPVICASGRNGVECYRQERGGVDLVLLDMMMPEQNGADTFRQLREFDPGVKVLLASGYSRDAEVDTLIGEGAVGFLPKPFEMLSLSKALAKALQE
ncbi:MAG: response regulator [Planctomycetota bacterium]|jgi:PAS domain S-box-containing protein